MFCFSAWRNLPLAYDCIIRIVSRSKETDAEEAMRLLERFVDETSRTDANSSGVLEPTSSSVGPDYSNVYWLSAKNPQRHSERITVLQGIVDAVPEVDMIRHLYEVFVTRCQGPLGNVVHKETFLEQAEIFCDCLSLALPESRVMALSNTFSMDAIACHLLAVRKLKALVNKSGLTFRFLTARARSCLSSQSIYSWLVSYTSDPLCRRASSLGRTL